MFDIKIMASCGSGMNFSARQRIIDHHSSNKNKDSKKLISDPESEYQNIFMKAREIQSEK